MGKVCAFLGNDYDFVWRRRREHKPNKQVQEKVREQIINLIENEDVSIFFVGEKGGYEEDAYDAVLDVKEQYPNIQIILVISKTTDLHPVGKDDSHEIYRKRYCDDWIYPDKCATGYKGLGIVYRNRFIAQNVDFIIGYNKYKGRAYEFIKQAKSKGAQIIELTELYDFD